MPQLNLNRELVQSLMRALAAHDDHAQEPRVAAQYLAALIGLLVGNERLRPDEKREFLRELSAFSEQVLADVLGQQEARPAPPAADPAKAFGIWKPPAK